jgi:mRNA-degrading endonuclease toxin of MazEF toxin-antitoxin module
MTDYRRGDVVLVGFVFDQGAGRKLRPALVVSTPAYHRGRREVVVVAAITGDIGRGSNHDHVLRDWKGAGLLLPSVVTGIIRTVPRAMVYRRLGSLGGPDLEAVEGGLRECLGL